MGLKSACRYEKGQEMHMQALPTQTEKMHDHYEAKKADLHDSQRGR